MSREIPDNINAQALELEAGLTYDGTGTGTLANAEDIFAKYLPENLTFEQVVQGQDAIIDFTNAQTLAASRASQKHVTVENPTTSLRTQIGHARIDTSYDRQRSGTAMGKEWKKYGVVSSDLTLGVGRRTSAYKAVVSYSGEEAAKAFSN